MAIFLNLSLPNLLGIDIKCTQPRLPYIVHWITAKYVYESAIDDVERYKLASKLRVSKCNESKETVENRFTVFHCAADDVGSTQRYAAEEEGGEVPKKHKTKISGRSFVTPVLISEEDPPSKRKKKEKKNESDEEQSKRNKIEMTKKRNAESDEEEPSKKKKKDTTKKKMDESESASRLLEDQQLEFEELL